RGTLTVTNPFGGTTLHVDDSADPAGRSATLDRGSLSGLSPEIIRWTPSPLASGGVTTLDIAGSSSSLSTYTIDDTPQLFFHTLPRTGTGQRDTVLVNGTTGSLYVVNGGGHDDVFVGDGTLSLIKGLVNVSGAGDTALLIEDSQDTFSRFVTLGS